MNARLSEWEARRELAQEAQARVLRLGLDGHPESPPEEWPPEGDLLFLPSTATAAEPWSRAVAARFRQRPPAPPAPPLPEAPVSITLKASLHGHEVLVTLRGGRLRQRQGAGRGGLAVAPEPDATAGLSSGRGLVQSASGADAPQ